MGEDPAKGVSNWGSLQVLPDALAGRVMIWRGLFATGWAASTPEPRSLERQAS